MGPIGRGVGVSGGRPGRVVSQGGAGTGLSGAPAEKPGGRTAQESGAQQPWGRWAGSLHRPQPQSAGEATGTRVPSGAHTSSAQGRARISTRVTTHTQECKEAHDRHAGLCTHTRAHSGFSPQPSPRRSGSCYPPGFN